MEVDGGPGEAIPPSSALSDREMPDSDQGSDERSFATGGYSANQPSGVATGEETEDDPEDSHDGNGDADDFSKDADSEGGSDDSSDSSDSDEESDDEGTGSLVSTSAAANESDRRTSSSVNAASNRRPRGHSPIAEAELDPELYGLRRTGRARIVPKRFETVVAESSEEGAGKKRRRGGGGGAAPKAPKGPSIEAGEISGKSSGSSDEEDPWGRRTGRSKKKTKKKKSRSAADSDDSTFGMVRFSTRNKTVQTYDEKTFDEAYAEEMELSGSELDDKNKKKRNAMRQEELLEEEGETIDKLLDFKYNEELGVDEFYVKWQGRSHLHNTWETTQSLREYRGFKKLQNYIKKVVEPDRAMREDPTVTKEEIEQQDIRIQMDRDMLEDYSTVERIIGQRRVERTEDYPSGVEFYCKWKRLDYNECTWEAQEDLDAREQIDAFFERENCRTLPYNSAPLGPEQRGRMHFFNGKQPAYMKGGELRDYQMTGIQWAASLWHRNENGILADEMGLGKTVQTICTLNYLFSEAKLYGPFLVVVPLSTIGAWQREFAKWAPQMNLIVYQGNKLARDIIRDHEFYLTSAGHAGRKRLKFNVLLTTYEIVLRDKADLGQIKWAYLAVDEAHRLKNQESQLHEALVGDFHTTNRLLITGTPLQNNVQELLSLIKFLMPGKFADLEDLEINLGDNAETQQKILEFHQRLKPFMCRRLKKDVEKDLPSKTERILRVELSPMQVRYYRHIITRNYEALTSEGSRPKSLLNIVMELKKVSDHPYLIDGADDTWESEKDKRLQGVVMNAGKMVLLDKLLTRLKADGHRVLIFSQLVMMLDILSEYVKLRNYSFQRLDGSVPAEARKKAIERFNAPDSPDFVFLLSTRAGGLGINLETADTVILFDSDWNPQNDLQAMARAHRIGQKKHVNVYRFVSKDTIEEDILERAKRKMVLEFSIMRKMDGSAAAHAPSSKRAVDPDNYSRDELQQILKFGAQNLFKSNENETTRQAQLEELNLDDILARAEHHETVADDEEGFEEFKDAWKIADFGADQMSWEDIIPEAERLKAEEDAKAEAEAAKRRAAEAAAAAAAAKKKAMAAAAEAEEASQPKKKSKKKAAAADAPGTPTSAEPKKKAAPVVSPTTLTEKDIRGLFRGLTKFGDIKLQYDRIVKEGQLEEKDRETVINAAERMLQACKQAIEDFKNKPAAEAAPPQTPVTPAGEEGGEGAEGAKETGTKKPVVSKTAYFDFEGAKGLNANQLEERHKELTALAQHLSKIPNLDQFRLGVDQFKAPANWDCSWTPKDDAMLLVGVFKYGFGSYEAMLADDSLGFDGKMFLGNTKSTASAAAAAASTADGATPAAETKESKPLLPKSAHLNRRAEANIKQLIAELKRGDAAPAPKKLESKHKSTSSLSGAPKPSEKGKEKADRPPKEGKDKSDDKEPTSPKKKTKSPKTKGDKDKERDPDELSQEDSERCRELLLPVKNALKELKKGVPDDITENKDKRQYLWDRVRVVAKQIRRAVDNAKPESRNKLEKNLWTYAGKKNANPMSGDQFRAMFEKWAEKFGGSAGNAAGQGNGGTSEKRKADHDGGGKEERERFKIPRKEGSGAPKEERFKIPRKDAVDSYKPRDRWDDRDRERERSRDRRDRERERERDRSRDRRDRDYRDRRSRSRSRSRDRDYRDRRSRSRSRERARSRSRSRERARDRDEKYYKSEYGVKVEERKVEAVKDEVKPKVERDRKGDPMDLDKKEAKTESVA